MPSFSLGKEGREKIDWWKQGLRQPTSDNNHTVHAPLWRARTSIALSDWCVCGGRSSASSA